MTATFHKARVPLLVGNWKMHKTLGQARADFAALGELTKTYAADMQLGIAPVSLHLSEVTLSKHRHIGVYAQNVHWEASGAFTGEHSAEMLKDLALQGSLVAHSERRQFFHETSRHAGLKIKALLRHGLEVIYCIGETLEERESGRLQEVLSSQICEAVAAAELRSLHTYGTRPGRNLFSIAYEPVWAIGTGKAATEVEAQEAHAFARKILAQVTTSEFASQARILYGGSVKPENITKFLSAPDIDGPLVGGASLVPKSFEQLCQGALSAIRNKHY